MGQIACKEYRTINGAMLQTMEADYAKKIFMIEGYDGLLYLNDYGILYHINENGMRKDPIATYDPNSSRLPHPTKQILASKFVVHIEQGIFTKEQKHSDVFVGPNNDIFYRGTKISDRGLAAQSGADSYIIRCLDGAVVEKYNTADLSWTPLTQLKDKLEERLAVIVPPSLAIFIGRGNIHFVHLTTGAIVTKSLFLNTSQCFAVYAKKEGDMISVAIGEKMVDSYGGAGIRFRRSDTSYFSMFPSEAEAEKVAAKTMLQAQRASMSSLADAASAPPTPPPRPSAPTASAPPPYTEDAHDEFRNEKGGPKKPEVAQLRDDFEHVKNELNRQFQTIRSERDTLQDQITELERKYNALLLMVAKKNIAYPSLQQD